MRWVEHLRAQPRKEQVQAMRRVEHLQAQPHKKPVQAMRRVEEGSRFNVETRALDKSNVSTSSKATPVYAALKKK
jgi:hypothetical protein